MVEPNGGQSHQEDPDSAITRKMTLTGRFSATEHTTIGDGSTDHNFASDGKQGLSIRCPHCQNPVKLSDDASDSFEDINCPDCGSNFSLIDQEGTQRKTAPP